MEVVTSPEVGQPKEVKQATQKLFQRYLRYLKDERRYSPATLDSYQRDLQSVHRIH